MNQQPPMPQVDLSLATDVSCDKCKNQTFQESVVLKHLSEIASPTGKPTYVPIPVFTCNACGHVNSEFLPAALRKPAQPQPAPAPSKLTLVK